MAYVRRPAGHSGAVAYIKSLNMPLLLLGGGGYTIRNVARAWTYETAIALDAEIPKGELEAPHAECTFDGDIGVLSRPSPPPSCPFFSLLFLRQLRLHF